LSSPIRAGLAAVLLLTACQGGGLSLAPAHECPASAPVAPASGASASQQPTTATADPSASAGPTPLNAEEVLAGVTAVQVETSLGSFTIELRADAAPIAAANFVALARCGFYDGVTFHRVLTGFVIQAGDPNTRENQGDFEGLGTGNPGYGFDTEVPPEGVNYDPYAVAMANAGIPNSNGSQFFVCLTDLNTRLPRAYSIFGNVTDGREVVDAIGQVEVNHPALGVPVDPVVINGMEVLAAESTPSSDGP
jgi:peptidyl-prolyl cis-trans isomerase B (cyclophilin B)